MTYRSVYIEICVCIQKSITLKIIRYKLFLMDALCQNSLKLQRFKSMMNENETKSVCCNLGT